MSDISITTSAVSDSGSASSASPAPSAPVSPPSDTGTGAPALAAPSDTSRPVSFAEALARREQAASDTATPPVPAQAAATPGVSPTETPDSPEAETAVDPNAPPAPEQSSGPIPFARHKAALENARLKEREAVAAQVQQQYGEHIKLGEAFRHNPVEAAIQVLSELQTNPAYAPQLTSLAARMLAQRRGQSQPQADAMPEPDLTGVDGNGQQVRFYSAEQQAKREAWMTNRLMAQMRQELAPLQQAHQQTEAQRAEQARVAQMTETISSRLGAWRQRPGFTEHEADLKPVQANYVAQGYDPWTAMGLAYADVVIPKLQAQQQTRLVASAARKAAGTTDNPATVTPTPPRRARSFSEAFERLAGGRA